MARSVFYSFHYENDVTRAMVVRNRWVTQGGHIVSGVIDHSDFERVQHQGDVAIRNWINKQLVGTSVTVVLIGAETLNRYYVKYEIYESLKRGNPVIGVDIHNIKNLSGKTSLAGDYHTIIGRYSNGKPIYFDDIATDIYDYELDNGYDNLGRWVEAAVG